MSKNKLILFFILFLAAFQLFINTAYAQSYDVRVTNIRFLYGVGRGPTHAPPNYLPVNYYRGYDMAGTLIELTAEMTVAGVQRPMYGDVRFTVQYTDGTNTGSFSVTILSGQNTGTIQIPYSNATGFLDSWIPITPTTGITQQWTYTVTSVTGGYAGALLSSASQSIYWDRRDPPHDADFPPAAAANILVSTTTTSIRLEWNPLNPSTGSGYYDEDFYEYRIYYKASADTTSPYRLWNGSNDPTLRGLVNNPVAPAADDPALHFSGSRKYTTIPNLEILTSYDYYIAAVDVFGNETPLPSVPFTALTQPYSVRVIISDGIDSFQDFTNLANPSLRPLRETNIKVDMIVVASKTPPDAVKVWFTYMTPDTDIVISNAINDTAFPPDTLFSVDAKKTGPNMWTAYLSTQTPIIRNGNSVRFIIESNIQGARTFSDYDPSDQSPNDDEWTFIIGTPVTLTPWPVRILNNVITNKNPKAYPSYYLSDDATVTITVYDIKGRPVAKIMDNAFRRGGQNIKEEGWTGNNKANRKLGIGLYYIHIKAKRVRDGKIILNEAKKVVIAK